MPFFAVRALTMRWSAPEALRGEPLTTECDVWSFGVVAWETFTDAANLYEGGANSPCCMHLPTPVQLRTASCRRTLKATIDCHVQRARLTTCTPIF